MDNSHSVIDDGIDEILFSFARATSPPPKQYKQGLLQQMFV
ncbi:hypothetical protein [Ferrovum myxofaciens]|nr:hypothetical protein [Ferrovum myxofaciens]